MCHLNEIHAGVILQVELRRDGGTDRSIEIVLTKPIEMRENEHFQNSDFRMVTCLFPPTFNPHGNIGGDLQGARESL